MTAPRGIVKSLHSTPPSLGPSLCSAVGEGSAEPGPRSLETGAPRAQGGRVWGSRRPGLSPEQGAQGVPSPKSPWGTRKGGGWAAEGPGLSEKTWMRGTKGRCGDGPACLRSGSDCGHRPAMGRSLGSREPARFTFFLAMANSCCPVSTDIPWGEGKYGIYRIAWRHCFH